MKKIILLAFLSLFFISNTVEAYVSVKGYYKSNGTYVAPYVRSNPNGLKSDNYSYTSSQSKYNDTYGTRGTEWDTPTYITDPNYYLGKSLYESGSSGYSSYSVPSCPTNSYYDGVSSCKCSYGYINSGGSCISANSACWNQLGYSSSYDSSSGTCKCDSGYVIGSSGQCISAYSYCSNKFGTMSTYNNLSKSCECLSGYEYDGSSCVYKTTSYSSYSQSSTKSNCPLNSHLSVSDSTKCECNYGYKVNSTKTSCVTTSYDPTTYSQTTQDDKSIGINYYKANKTCSGLKNNDNQYAECISYAYNH